MGNKTSLPFLRNISHSLKMQILQSHKNQRRWLREDARRSPTLIGLSTELGWPNSLWTSILEEDQQPWKCSKFWQVRPSASRIYMVLIAISVTTVRNLNFTFWLMIYGTHPTESCSWIDPQSTPCPLQKFSLSCRKTHFTHPTKYTPYTLCSCIYGTTHLIDLVSFICQTRQILEVDWP